MAGNVKASKYVEPDGFFPKDVRKKFKIGEYNDDVYGKPEAKKKAAAKKPAPKKKTK